MENSIVNESINISKKLIEKENQTFILHGNKTAVENIVSSRDWSSINTEELESNIKDIVNDLSLVNESFLQRVYSSGAGGYDNNELIYIDTYKRILETVPQVRGAFRKKAAAVVKNDYVIYGSSERKRSKLSILLEAFGIKQKIRIASMQLDAFGNSIWAIIYDKNKNPVDIKSLPLKMLEIDDDNKVYIAYNSVTGKTEKYNYNEIIHFRRVDFETGGNFFFGRSQLRPIINILNAYNVLQSYTASVLKAYMKPLLLFRVDSVLDESTASNIIVEAEQLRDSGIGVVSNSVIVDVIENKNLSDNSLEFIKHLENVIAVSLDIPPLFMGDQSATEASARVLQDIYYDEIEATQEILEGVINNKLIPLLMLKKDEAKKLRTDEFGNFYKTEIPMLPIFKFIKPERLDTELRIKMIRDLYNGDTRIITRDEARKLFGLVNDESNVTKNLFELGDFKTITNIVKASGNGSISREKQLELLGIDDKGETFVSPNTRAAIESQEKLASLNNSSGNTSVKPESSQGNKDSTETTRAKKTSEPKRSVDK